MKYFYEHPYEKTLASQVISCRETPKGFEVVLDRTIFYPTGGGQPCDLGTLGEAKVLDVADREGKVVHLCDKPLCGEVVGCIDWERRFRLMQSHSGEHLVSGLIHRRFGYENVGFHMGADTITIDFSGIITPEELEEIEQEANRAIWANIPVQVLYPDAEELKTIPYRSKKELSGWVRLVRFGDIDTCACCGMHVAQSGEIGLVKLLSTVKFHDGSRIELLCGGQALDYLNGIYRQNREISGLLSAKPLETAAAVRRMAEEQSALQYRMVQLENRNFAMLAEKYSAEGKWLVFLPPMGADGLRRFADTLLQAMGKCAVFSGEGNSYKYALAATEGDVRPTVKELNQALGGRGGGKPGFAQGSVNADRETIAAYCENLKL